MSPVPDTTRVTINRAPVLTLWAAVVAERLGYAREEALTLGKAVAGLNAQSKGRSLGLFEPRPKPAGPRAARVPRPDEPLRVELLQRAVPAARTPQGLRALHEGRPIPAESVERYLEGKFKESLDATRDAMESLAASFPKGELAARAFALYEKFRPVVPAGTRGWGAAGVLDLGLVRSLASKRRGRGAAHENPERKPRGK
jgi:hypothetical protein